LGVVQQAFAYGYREFSPDTPSFTFDSSGDAVNMLKRLGWEMEY
jgi:hypothetical protein